MPVRGKRGITGRQAEEAIQRLQDGIRYEGVEEQLDVEHDDDGVIVNRGFESTTG